MPPFTSKNSSPCFPKLQHKCLGRMDATIQENLNFPDDINEIHVCYAKNNSYVLRTTVKSSEEIEEFLNKWTKESRVVWRVNKTCPRRNAAGLKNIYWKEFRCQSSNLKVSKNAKKLHKKHTGCEAYMTITIKKVANRCRSRDTHMPKYPTVIRINSNHNHLIQHMDYLKNSPVSQETKTKFLKMFKKGHNALSALNLHRIDLQREYGNSIVFAEMDRSICPDNQWCYRLYASFLANKEIVPDSDEECETNIMITEDTESPEPAPPSPTECDNSCDIVEKASANQLTYAETECCPIENLIYGDDPSVKIEYEYDDIVDDTSSRSPSVEECFEEEDIIVSEQQDPLDEEDFEKDDLVQETGSYDENRVSKEDNYYPPSNLTEQEIRKYMAPFVKFMTIKLRTAPELYAPAMDIFNNRLRYFENDLEVSEALFKFGK
ncbi:uncharacterized protein LOC135844010 [Planococcus citri]|uniref:uncharacterized protein LOC135844010 n=1 Tax=Planococcus citri TaxID=170843 RepID=UPI0031F97C0F